MLLSPFIRRGCRAATLHDPAGMTGDAVVMIARNPRECGRKVARDARIVAGK